MLPTLCSLLLSPFALTAGAPVADVFVDVNASSCASGAGSLSDPVCSIGAAVGLAAAGDTIRIAPGTYVENVTLPFDLDLIGTSGSGATIVDGGALGTVITIPTAVTVMIEGLTVTNGRADRGGGILSDGTLLIRNSTVTGNTTTGMTGPPNQGGAGISTSGYTTTGNITIENCTISENHSTAPSFAGAAGVFLGGGTLTISNSTIHANSAIGGNGGNGGGVFAGGPAASSVSISQTTVSENVGGFYGGGIHVSDGSLALVDSTISGNSSTIGAGLNLYFCRLTVRNSTLSGNVANRGGAFSTYDLDPGSYLSSSTVVGNQSNGPGPAGFLTSFSASPLEVQNSIIAGNVDTSSFNSEELFGDFPSLFISLGNNVIGTTLVGFIDGLNGDRVGSNAIPLDPLLGPLQFNAGPTRTHAPRAGSPALDAGNPMNFEAFDQRGLSRPMGNAPDIGAVESEGPTISVCNGDGGDGLGCTDCPCGNNAQPGTAGGCLNSAGASARLERAGSTSVSLPQNSTIDLRFRLGGASPGTFCLLTSSEVASPTSPANPCFGLNSGSTTAQLDGLDCKGGPFRRHGTRVSDMSGDVGVTNSPWGGEGAPAAGIAMSAGGFSPGQTRYFQVVYRDSVFASCVAGLNTSQAVEIQFTP